MTRHRIAAWAGSATLLGVLLAWAVGWGVLHEPLRAAWWELLASRPLTDEQQARLAACEELGWWAWVRILEGDVAHRCGEPWAHEQLTGLLRSPARHRWALARAPGWTAGNRFRVAAAAEAAGHAPGGVDWGLFEPSVPAEVRDEWLRSTWAEGRGPRVRTLAAAVSLRHDAEIDEERIAALRVLAALGGADEALAHDLVRERLGLDEAALSDLGEERPHTLAEPWAVAVERIRACAVDCTPAWIDLLEVTWRDEDGAGMPAGPREGAPPPDAGAVEVLLAFDAEPHVGDVVRRWLALEADALRGDPARLLDDLGQPGPVPESLALQLWTGRTGPWTAALVALEVGGRAGVDVVVGGAPTGLSVAVGGREAVRCGASGSGAWSKEVVAARALREIRPAPPGVEVAAARLGGWSVAAGPVFPLGPGAAEPPDPCGPSGSRGTTP